MFKHKKLPIGIKTRGEGSQIRYVYRRGGSYCSKCQIIYSFEETLKLLNLRCFYCHYRVRVRPIRKRDYPIFWDFLEKRKKNV